MSAVPLSGKNERFDTYKTLPNELVELMLSLPSDMARFRRLCRGLGLDPTIPRVAIALDVSAPDVFPSRVDSELDRTVVAMSRQLRIACDELVRMVHRQWLVILVPTMRGESIFSTDRQFQVHADALLRTVPGVSAVGIGPLNDGPLGWATSVNEALKALETGLRGGTTNGVFRYSDIAVSDAVLSAANVMRYVNSLLERIVLEPELLSTLSTYFDHGQQRKLTAGVLRIHPNTLNYRLERVESILGARLNDAAWVSRLHAAIQIWRLSHIQKA